MKSVQTIAAIATIVVLSACSTVMTTAPSGYLSNDSTLSDAPDATSASWAAAEAINPAQVSISDIVWRVDARADISNDERDALLSQLRSKLHQGLQALPPSPQGRPAQIRAAITRVETVSPALNAVSSLLLIAPWDRGGAAVEIEAVDAQTGRQLAAMRLGYFAPLSDITARFSKLAPAEIAVRKAAVDFVSLLNPASDAGRKTAQR